MKLFNWTIPEVEEAQPFIPKSERQKQSSVTVAEIHNAFFSEVDRLLEESKLLNSLESPIQNVVQKADRLRKLGFNNTKDVSVAKDEEQRLQNLRRENEQKTAMARAIEYFTVKYPQHKFIIEDSVKKICKKYGLIYGPVENYVGTVPDKNLEQIEQFKIRETDECYERVQPISGWGPGGERLRHEQVSYFDKKQFENERKRGSNYGLYGLYNRDGNNMFYRKSSLEIAAPYKDFDTTDMIVKDHKLSNAPIPVPDPIVLCPVIFEGSKHYLVVTAWGDEAKDVVNEKLN